MAKRPNGHFHPTAHFGFLGTKLSLATFTQQHILGTELSLATFTQQHYFGLKSYLATFTQHWITVQNHTWPLSPNRPILLLAKWQICILECHVFPKSPFLYPDLHLATFIHWPNAHDHGYARMHTLTSICLCTTVKMTALAAQKVTRVWR